MVNWQSTDAEVRLMASVFAAEPGFRVCFSLRRIYNASSDDNNIIQPDIKTIAILYGRGATEHAINHQLQKVRKLAKSLTEEARKNGSQLPRGIPQTPRMFRTPRTPRTRSTGKSNASLSKSKLLDTPCKTGKPVLKHGNSVVDPITVESDDESDSDGRSTKSVPADDQVKKEEDEDDKKVRAFTPVVPFRGFGQAFLSGDSGPVRVSSQTNGYVDTPKKPAQTPASGYSYDMIADYM
ncbi:hypothetical protein UA08_00726 [Talaromyces atroroseus]|uniref:Uncharacterized protein n=1 Tax=Talaromyces atroroseus TaxID=1441469 RepID=A0A225B368_TALAT|nr:hypothetical protein UA08_00726 [Talaromyces atroroseus]OKL64168.1 hypothetical protein UA08_00726 [Talaromyces atroroseus]